MKLPVHEKKWWFKNTQSSLECAYLTFRFHLWGSDLFLLFVYKNNAFGCCIIKIEACVTV